MTAKIAALQRLHDSDEACLRMAAAYDREEAAQMGEPSPHVFCDDEFYAEWVAERIACARAAIKALMAQEGE